MGRAGTEHPQLKALADLLRNAHEATDLKRLADAVVAHVRDGIPPSRRNPTQLKNLLERLLSAFDDVYAESIPYSDHHAAVVVPVRPGYSPSPLQTLAESIRAAAAILDRVPQTRWDGSALRSAIDALAVAARNLASRRCSMHAMQVVRDLEQPGAPPALVYLPNGALLWENYSLRDFMARRSVDRHALLNVVGSFAGPFCQQARTPAKGAPRKAGRVPHPPVYLAGEILRAPGNSEAAVVIKVSEAHRATELSKRELQVARTLCGVTGYRDVADSLGISLDSVRTHLRRAYRKLGISNRHDLKDRLIRDGLLQP